MGVGISLNHLKVTKVKSIVKFNKTLKKWTIIDILT